MTTDHSVLCCFLCSVVKSFVQVC